MRVTGHLMPQGSLAEGGRPDMPGGSNHLADLNVQVEAEQPSPTTPGEVSLIASGIGAELDSTEALWKIFKAKMLENGATEAPGRFPENTKPTGGKSQVLSNQPSYQPVELPSNKLQ
eukprot:Skav222872  [mRNA]  locus=scaffold2201:445965:448541:- [translate_table: standard]